MRNHRMAFFEYIETGGEGKAAASPDRIAKSRQLANRYEMAKNHNTLPVNFQLQPLACSIKFTRSDGLRRAHWVGIKAWYMEYRNAMNIGNPEHKNGTITVPN